MSQILQPLNLPPYPFKLQVVDSGHKIYCDNRKKWLICTPEEWVRQHFVKYLENHLNYPAGLIAVETGLTVNGMFQRADVVVYSPDKTAKLIVECKAPKIKLSNKTFEQAARYNLTLKVPFLIISNGLDHHCAQIDVENKDWKSIDHFPSWEEICRG